MQGRGQRASTGSLVGSNAVALARTYFLTSMVKFPLVFSKNGILNAVLVIGVLGGICSGISNFLIARLTRKLNESTYLGLSSKTLGWMHSLVALVVLVQRSLGILYSVDLTFRFLKTAGLPQLGTDMQMLCLLFAVLLAISLVCSDPALLSFSNSRNILAFLVLSAATITMSFSKFAQNQHKISIRNHAETFFDSFGLTAICFAQQIATAPVCAADFSQGWISIALGSIMSALAYISIGLAGYISCPAPDVNWLANHEHALVRSLCSLALLGVNLITFPLALDPVKKELENALLQIGLKKRPIISTLTLVVLYTFASIPFVASRYGAICCLFFSSFVMLIFPSAFYLQTYKVGRKGRVLAIVNMTIGVGLVCKAVADLAGFSAK